MENPDMNQLGNIDKIDNEVNVDLNLEEYLANLIKEKDLLATQGKYLEAEIIRKKINEIKNNTISQNKRELEDRQFREMKQLEESFNDEIKKVNDFWENEFNNFQIHYTELTQSMDERHKKELMSLKEYIDDKFNKNFKFSKEYLDLKTTEMNLVKQERYVEAHTIKHKCDIMEKSEIEKHIKLKEENFSLKSENMIKQQNLEKRALEQKMNSEYEEMAKVKQIELDKIINKYKNKKYDLETKQGKEKNIHCNENLLKANIFNANLINFNNYENLNSINKSVTKPVSVNRFNSIADIKLKDMSIQHKKPEKKGLSNNAVINKRASRSNLYYENNNVNINMVNMNNSTKQFGNMNKSQRMFNTNGTGPIKHKSQLAKGLQYTSVQNFIGKI